MEEMGRGMGGSFLKEVIAPLIHIFKTLKV